MLIKERIIQLIEYKKIPKEDFYTRIGMTSANFRGKAKATPLNSTAIENILSEIPDVNPEWLLTGKGSMLKEKTKNAVSLNESENSKLIRDLIDKNERLSQRIGELVNENEHLHKNITELKAEINVLKKEMANKNTQRNSVYSYPDIAAEPKDEE